MPLVCPNCRRTLGAGTADAPRFCMYCGQRLAADPSPDPGGVLGLAGETQAFLPDPAGSADPSLDTRTFASPPAGAVPQVADRVAGYTLVRFLGAGGMGTVYEAEASGSGRRVAVKLLSNRLTANPASVERFRQEGRVASQITHPRCVFVLGADTDAGRPFIVMELMPGRTLKDLVDQRGPLPVPEAVARILDVIEGLAEAHRQGVIHRDVKPSNCFLTADDRVKIGDFGLSKSLTADDDSEDEAGADARHLTTSGAFLGTVMYASPEQIRGEPVGYDSDVYAVCGTLYYLLAGQAPFQHESLTASLAKAVSEPAPAIRSRRPDVPRELERVVRRGLDRDRTRRWPTLDALRDALVGLQPDTQRPARPGALVLAFVCDYAIAQVLALPVELARQAAVDPTGAEAFDPSWPWLAVLALYFVVLEGVTGTTVGKRLLRLQVVKLGGVGPPGVAAGAGRFAVFALVMGLIFVIWDWDAAGRPSGYTIGTTATAVGLVVAARQLRRSAHGWRGVHDFASGCRVVQRDRPPHRPRLVSRYPNPLDRVEPGKLPAPAAVGGFAVVGRLSTLADGSEVWLADDRGLGRRVLLHVRPASTPAVERPGGEVTRPTRLRVLGRGYAPWPVGGGKVEARGWTATVAPAGAPLVDLTSPDRPLMWADARPILEQLVDELATGASDGSAAPAGVAQVWVEPTGRPQLLDFPLPKSRPNARLTPPAAAMDLVRQVATLALEGEARTAGDRIRAPLPLHASTITDRLFTAADPYTSLEDLREDLAENATKPAAVTSGLRRAHLGVWVPLVAPGLLLMVLLSGLGNFAWAVVSAGHARKLAEVQVVVTDPVARAEFVDRHPDQAAAVAPDRLGATLELLDKKIVEQRDYEAQLLGWLNRPERLAFDRLLAAGPPGIDLRRLGRPEPDEATRRVQFLRTLAAAMAVPLLIWAVLSFAFRGGFALAGAGIAHVRADGGRPGRFRVTVRELVVWLPLTLALWAALWVQLMHPQWVAVRTGLWLGAVGLLPVYLVVALVYPARPPQDRLLGMYLVPR